MNDNLIKQLTNLSKQLGADRLISEDDKKEILNSIIAVLAQFKGEVENVNTETVKAVNKVLKQIQVEHDRYVEEAINTTEKTKTKVTEAVTGVMKELENVKKLCQEVMDSKPEDGDDADEEYIIEEIIKKLKPLEQNNVVSDDGTEIVAKINSLSLENENKIDFSHIKNAPEFKNGRWSGITKGAVLKLIQESGGAGVTLKVGGTNNVVQGTLDLIAGSGITIVDNGDGTVTFTSTGGGGISDGDKGDITVSSTGSVWTIDNGVVTLAKQANMATGSLVYRKTAGAGAPEVQTLATLKTDLLLTGTNSGDQTSIVGITGTTTEFNTALTGDDFLFISALDTDVSLSANSDSRIASQKAVKSYIDSAVTGLLDLKGDTDCSTNPNYPSALKGDAYYVTVAGKIGGASGKTVEIGDVYVAKADNAGGTEASVGTSWFVLNQNLSGVALTSGTLAQFAATTSAQLAGVISDETGSGALVFANSPTLTTPRFADLGFIADANGNEMVAFNSNASAVNYLEIENGATGLPPHLRAMGDDTNIGLHLVGKGTGEVSVCDATDETKRMRFGVSNNATGAITTFRSNSTASRTIDLPDATDTLVGKSTTDTLANKTLTSPIINGASLNGDIQIDATPNSDDLWNGKSTNTFNAAATIAQFDCVYLTSSSTWGLTDADAIGTAGNVLIMMAGAAGTASNPLRVIEPGSWVRNDAWNWTVGGVLYLDTTTPGGMTQTAPSGEDDAVKIVGHAVSADVIYFAPSPNWIIYKA